MFEHELAELGKRLLATTKPAKPMFFKLSSKFRKLCSGFDQPGLEIGPAAHNSFGLPSVGLAAPDWDDFQLYAEEQYRLCGEWTRPDHFAEADRTPFPDRSFPWVLASHVLEHLPDPIGALLEWHRVVVTGGILYVVVPHRNALESDRGRPVSTIEQMQKAHEEHWSVLSAPWPEGKKRSHLWVFDMPLVRALARVIEFMTGCMVVDFQETDDKVGNGHVFMLQRTKL